MTQPRMCLPGTTYLVTRTCSERRLLLNPSPVVKQVFGYCLARAHQGLEDELGLHAVSVQSNHYHLVVTDHSGDALPRFMHALNRLVACCLKEHYGKTHPEEHLEALWARRPYHTNVLLTPRAVLDKIAYTLTNPVKDVQVPDYRKWPGFHTKPRHWDMPPREFERPRLFFDGTEVHHRKLPLRLTAPPILLRGTELRTVIDQVEEVVHNEQRRLVKTLAADGHQFLGAQRVLAQDPFDAPRHKLPRSAITPRLASGGDGAAMRTAKNLLRSFRAAYRRAYKLLIAGKDTVFPYGTLMLRQRHRVACEPAFHAPWCVEAPS